MKQPKERVIAIDYFRGICILMVLLDHSALFSWPYYYLAGGGVLWTTAAEIFLLLAAVLFVLQAAPYLISCHRRKRTLARSLRRPNEEM